MSLHCTLCRFPLHIACTAGFHSQSTAQGTRGGDCDLLFPCSSLPQHYRLLRQTRCNNYTNITSFFDQYSHSVKPSQVSLCFRRLRDRFLWSRTSTQTEDQLSPNFIEKICPLCLCFLPSWVLPCGLRSGGSRTRNIRIYLSLSSVSPIVPPYENMPLEPVSSGVSRMRSVALCLRRHGITMQMGQWNLSQGKLLPPIESFICCRPLLPATDHYYLLQTTSTCYRPLPPTTALAFASTQSNHQMCLVGVKLGTCRK